jgi:hypothetical protein
VPHHPWCDSRQALLENQEARRLAQELAILAVLYKFPHEFSERSISLSVCDRHSDIEDTTERVGNIFNAGCLSTAAHDIFSQARFNPGQKLYRSFGGILVTRESVKTNIV